MQKKGLSYVDWIISMGVFIIIVLAIFVFLKPGAQPEFQATTLFTILEEEFKTEAEWTQTSVPLTIDQLANGTLVIELMHDPSSDWEFSGQYYAAANYPELSIGVTSTTVTIACINASSCSTQQAGGAPRAGIYFVSKEKNTVQQAGELQINANCNPSVSPLSCDFVLGAREDITGLKETKVDILKNDQYDLIKQRWDYPQPRDFSITLVRANSTQETIVAPQTPVPEQASVFVRELKHIILHQSGERETVTINMRVW